MQDASFRGLVSLGIAAIGGTTVAAFSVADADRYQGIAVADLAATKAGASYVPPIAPAPAPAAANGHAAARPSPTGVHSMPAHAWMHSSASQIVV